jgi:hypothetical protein
MSDNLCNCYAYNSSGFVLLIGQSLEFVHLFIVFLAAAYIIQAAILMGSTIPIGAGLERLETKNGRRGGGDDDDGDGGDDVEEEEDGDV